MDRKLIGLMRTTLIRRYGEALWNSLMQDDAAVDGGPSDSLACWLGRDVVPEMEETYPSLFARHADLESFIRGLGDELPVSGIPDDGVLPVAFRHARSPDGQILLRVEADCVVCALVQGVIAGAAIHYGEQVSIEEIKSRKRGDNVCVLQMSVGIAAAAPHEYVAVGNA